MLKSKGRLVYDHLSDTKHFEPWWAMLLCDWQIQKYYAWHLLKWGIKVNTASPWGAHISVIKGEKVDPVKWKTLHGKMIEFEYDPDIKWDNGEHAWINVYCETLTNLRVELGLTYRPRFHLTIGRLD